MLDALRSSGALVTAPAESRGDRRPLVMQARAPARICLGFAGRHSFGVLRGGGCSGGALRPRLCLEAKRKPRPPKSAPQTQAQSRAPLPPLNPQTVISDDEAKLGTFQDPAPRWLGNIIAWILNLVGPKGLEFAKCGAGRVLTFLGDGGFRAFVCVCRGPPSDCAARALPYLWRGLDVRHPPLVTRRSPPASVPPIHRYSIDYHYIRNWLYCQRHMGAERCASLGLFGGLLGVPNRDGTDREAALPKTRAQCNPFPLFAKPHNIITLPAPPVKPTNRFGPLRPTPPQTPSLSGLPRASPPHTPPSSSPAAVNGTYRPPAVPPPRRTAHP